MHTVYQHWDPLKVCLVGRGYPPEFFSTIKNPKVRSSMERMATETEEDFQTLITLLEKFGVEVLRVDVSDNMKDYCDIHGILNVPPPMCPRDHTAMVGDTFYMPGDMYGENFNVTDIYWSIFNDSFKKTNTQSNREKVLAQYIEDLLHPGRPLSPELSLSLMKTRKNLEGMGCQFLMGLDREEVEKVIMAAEMNTIGSVDKFPSNKRFYAFKTVDKWLKDNNVPVVYDQYINTASMTRVGKDLYFNFVNIVNKINEDMFLKKWRRLFPDYRVQALEIPGHGDGTYCPVKPGLIVSLKDPEFYAKTFPGWEVVTLKGQSWNAMRPFLNMKKKNHGRWWIPGEEDNQDLVDYVDSWFNHWVTYVEETVFDVNMLVIDEKNVICNNYNEKAFEAFERYGVTPHLVNFRHRYFWDGGLHCITSDISRVGDRKDYFPDRD